MRILPKTCREQRATSVICWMSFISNASSQCKGYETSNLKEEIFFMVQTVRHQDVQFPLQTGLLIRKHKNPINFSAYFFSSVFIPLYSSSPLEYTNVPWPDYLLQGITGQNQVGLVSWVRTISWGRSHSHGNLRRSLHQHCSAGLPYDRAVYPHRTRACCSFHWVSTIDLIHIYKLVACIVEETRRNNRFSSEKPRKNEKRTSIPFLTLPSLPFRRVT